MRRRKNDLGAWFESVTADARITTLPEPMGDGPVGAVYLIHLEAPFGHARHYTGWAANVPGRLWHHYNGSGAYFIKLVNLAGIEWHVSRIDYNATRQDERRCKNRGGASRRCPTCHAARHAPVVSGGPLTFDTTVSLGRPAQAGPPLRKSMEATDLAGRARQA